MKKKLRKIYRWWYALKYQAEHYDKLCRLEDTCRRIYYARIAMNSESVSKHLDKIDEHFRYGVMPDEYRGD